MSRSKVAITVERASLAEIDRLVRRKVYPSRSRAIQDAIDSKLAGLAQTRLARECALLDPAEERRLAEDGMSDEAGKWPEY